MKRLAALLFLLSGACGLVYEVVWTRMMTHVFGSTALAVGTVLAAFMTGLALGSWLLGRFADRVDRPLRFYAVLEAGVAVAAAVAHVLLANLAPAYLAVHDAFGGSGVALAVARFLMAFLLIVAPTILMGATLPVLARFVVKDLASVGAGLSTLYAINTIGAVGGAVAAGFWLIGAYGVHGATIAAIIGNAVIALVAWFASARWEKAGSEAPAVAPVAAERAEEPGDLPAASVRLALAGLAVSGMTSFAYEVYWSRCLHFIVGNSTYAVTTVLVAFLTGIALGGYAARFLMRRGVDALATFGWLQVLIGVSAAMAMPVLFGAIAPESLREHTLGGTGGFWPLVLSRFGVAALVMLLPALLIGMTFPLVGRIVVRRVDEAGASIGRAYAINTAGNVLGALLPGLVLIHWLGLQRGILVMAALNLLVGFAVLLTRRPGRAVLAALAVVVVAGLVAPLSFRLPLAPGGDGHRVLYLRDGPSATTAVLLNPETREMQMTVDGVSIGGNGVTDYKQQLLAHLPKLLLDDVADELSVGLGSGILAGESARHARVRSLTCVEIEPTVVEGAASFEESSRRLRANPAVEVVVDDVATYLRTTTRSFDVVSADEKTAEEYASNGFSYSRDYYELIRRRLKPRGLVIQWVPTELPHRQYRMILRTFTAAFPHVQLWYFGPALMSGTSNTILVGSNERIGTDLARARARMAADPAAFSSLSRYGLGTAEAVLAQYWTDREVIAAAVAGDPVNTLEHPRYEFYAPDDYAAPGRHRLAANFDFLMQLRGRTADSAEDEYLAGVGKSLHNAPPEEVIGHFERAIERAPWNENLRARVFAQYWEMAGRYLALGIPEAVAELDRLGLKAWDREPMAHVEYALALERVGRPDLALASARRAVAMAPDLVAARRVLAGLQTRSGQHEEARTHLSAILAIEPDDVNARRLLEAR